MRLRFITGFAGAAVLMLTAFAVLAQESVRGAASLEKTHWTLTWVDGTRVQGTAPRQAYIQLDPGTGRLNGFGGCNQLMGGYQLDGDHLRLTGMTRTLMACRDGVGTEGMLVGALEQVRRWKISGGELELRDDAGHDLARFTATAQP